MTEYTATPSEVLLLGMIYEKPQHGYELNRLIEERGIRNWANIGFSSIYYLLEKLESRGLVKSEGAGSKAKKTFTITAGGRKACRINTTELIEGRVASRNPFMNGLANSFVLTEKAMTKLLKKRLSDLSNQVGALNMVWDQQKPVPKPAEYLFSFSISQMEAEVAWITEVLGQLEK